MLDLGTRDDLLATRLMPATMAQSRRVLDNVSAEAALQLPVLDILTWPRSWEGIAVAAGIDREARELSPAERRLADLLARAT